MASTAIAKRNFNFNNEAFVKEDSEEGVVLYKLWLEKHPQYTLRENDASGRNALMVAYAWGNVSVVEYIVDNLDPADKKNILNLLTVRKDTIFGQAVEEYSKTKPSVDKVVKCAEQIIGGGGDVNNLTLSWGCVPKNVLCDLVDFVEQYATSEDFETRIGRYAGPLIKLYIKKGAEYRGMMGYDANPIEKSQWIREAEAAIQAEEQAKWFKMRVLWLAHQKDASSPLSKQQVPTEIINKIHDWSEFLFEQKE